MCFSATASFLLAAATASIGVAVIKQVRRPREMLVAIVPMLFASQQMIEGVLWLELTGNAASDSIAPLSLAFLILAEVVWPAYTALAVLLIEPNDRRRVVLSVIALAGCILSIHLLSGLLENMPLAAIRNHSIAYANEAKALSWKQIPYLLCTCVPLLISSHRVICMLGAAVLFGFLVSALVYSATFVSVWCFFAAANSTLLYYHFKTASMPLRQSYK